MKYNYFLGGITIASDIYYPELLPSPFFSDVTLSYGEVPEHLENNIVDFPFIEANETQYLLKLPRLGRYLVENGNRIIIKKDGEMSARDLEKQVLTSPFAVLSYQRDFIPFHGGAFIHDGKAVLISGSSGTGKSSVLTSLHKLGYKIISDDISNIKIINGKPVLYPSFPRIMIWKNVVRLLDIDIEKLEKLRDDVEKYFYPTGNDLLEPVEVKKSIFFTVNESTANPNVTGLTKVTILRENVFHPWMMSTFNKHVAISKEILFLGNFINSSVIFSNLNDSLKAFSASIVKSLDNA